MSYLRAGGRSVFRCSKHRNAEIGGPSFSALNFFVGSLLIIHSEGVRLPFWPGRSPAQGSRMLSCAPAERNKGPIWEVLSSTVLPIALRKDGSSNESLKVLEVAAGSGVHTQYFASQLSKDSIKWEWYPTDPDKASRQSIQERIDLTQLPIQSPLCLTLGVDGAQEGNTDAALGGDVDLILCVNMIHISPWEATVGLMKLAKNKLREGGVLYCYGPYKVDNTAVQSNLDFDLWLKNKNPDWGVRDLEAVVEQAKGNGLSLFQTIEMPANNLSVILKKSADV